MILPFVFPAEWFSGIAGRKRRRTQRGKCPPPDSDPFSDTEFGENWISQSRQIAATSNHRFQFQKRSQLFIGPHNEAFPPPRCASAIHIVRLRASMAET